MQHIKKHTESLQKSFKDLSVEQVIQLKLMALVFYFKLPRWKIVVEQYIKSPIDKEKSIADTIKESTSSYQEITEKSC
ncbi:hypothetical protein DCO56_09080 [Sphingobacterium athyrii]|uniref:Uncharacterized protein n=1 Tax=Sphingobacterium athyrii TaxID=2152717 RepID=A0A363NWA2_9SPHI|nr:hypothetical protein DCO56_09080 [Sphingobacterium athyrii]